MAEAQALKVLARVGLTVRQGLWFSLVVGVLGAGSSIGMARAQSVTVRTEEFRGATEGVEALIDIPVVSGVGDASAEWQLNRDIRQEVLALAGAVAASAWQYRARNDPAPATGRGQQQPDRVQVDYEVTHQSANLISLRVACYLDTGARPGLTWLDGITVEIKTGKRLSLADLFSPAIDYRQVIGWMLSEQIDSDQRAFLEGARKQVWSFTESNFYIRDNDLVIFFRPGEIAPFSLAFVEGITMDVRSGRQLGLSDLFKPGVDYQSIIAKEVERQILMHPEDYYPEARDHASEFLEEYFYVSSGDIVVIFNLYELAGSCREFRVSSELFGDSLSEYLAFPRSN